MPISICARRRNTTGRRAARPNGANKTLYSHNAVAVGWDAFHLAEVLLTQPLLVIVGSKPGLFGALRDGYEIVRRAKSQHKELVVVEGWSHYDLYDKPEPVAQALEKLVPFLTPRCKRQPEGEGVSLAVASAAARRDITRLSFGRSCQSST